MRPCPRARTWRLAACVALVACLVAADGFAIEMFTYFGDGSRIGLPNLEVPIEAYPGIPLRSDRLRARRRAMRMGPGSAVQAAPPGLPRGITIRAMPADQPVATTPARRAEPDVASDPPAPAPQPAADLASEPPVAPEPEEVEAPAAPVSPPSGS